jgi:hypothetical protein
MMAIARPEVIFTAIEQFHFYADNLDAEHHKSFSDTAFI